MNVSDVLPSVLSFVTVTVMAILGINLFKWLDAKGVPFVGFGGLTANA